MRVRFFSISHPIILFPPCWTYRLAQSCFILLLRSRDIASLWWPHWFKATVQWHHQVWGEHTAMPSKTVHLQSWNRILIFFSTLRFRQCNSRCFWINVQFCLIHNPYSSRFGLRADPIKAMERARYFMCWSPPYDVSPPQTSIKKFMICSFTPIGVLSLLQAGLLEPGDGSDASRSGTSGTKALCITNFAELPTRAPRSFTTNSRTSATRWSKVSPRGLCMVRVFSSLRECKPLAGVISCTGGDIPQMISNPDELWYHATKSQNECLLTFGRFIPG